MLPRLTLCGLLLLTAAQAQQPASLPVFHFRDHDVLAAHLTDFLHRHFKQRRGGYRTMFNKEYLTLADLWMDAAIDAQHGRPVQELYPEGLLGVKIDDDGYVSSHQHFSHAHDDGWPFPLWPQMIGSYAGRTYGWHFQDSGPGWLWQFGFLQAGAANTGVKATEGWQLEGLEDLGIRDGRWHLRLTGERAAITSPAGVRLDALNVPFLQLRWSAEGEVSGLQSHLEWRRRGDDGFDAERRLSFPAVGSSTSEWTGMTHSLLSLHDQAGWEGTIEGLRIVIDPATPGLELAIDSIFTVYDTRHAINNPIFVLASYNVFRWTGDLTFLRRNIGSMRTALRYQQTVMGGVQHDHIRNRWPGHDGLPGWERDRGGDKQARPGHGIGNNYFDLLPFGWDDCYATAQYHACLLAMADIEEAIARHDDWQVPPSDLAFDPAELREHAAAVRQKANAMFWDERTGRFVACIDREGNSHDYGYTFLGLDAIHYGLASPEHARTMLEWIAGDRIVEGDTSTGADIYRWRFGPRVSTLRNVDWYGQVWTAPESIPFGGQIQDGGAVLGFAFFDIMARLCVRGADDAWERLVALLDWEAEVQVAGGYRKYYADGKRGTTLQGCGTAGGIGVDCEFHETSLVPSVVVYGFLGLDPRADHLCVDPRLPEACPEIGIDGLRYHSRRLDLRASNDALHIEVYGGADAAAIVLELPVGWRRVGGSGTESEFRLDRPGAHSFHRSR